MSLADRYTILEKLGEGGMAEVYRAQHLLLEREVAIKFVHPAMGDDPEFDQRFKREAQAIARLTHPNIIHVYDFDRDATRGYFMVMELLQGDDLAHYLRRFRKNEEFMPLAEVLRITRDIAEALSYAHQHGVIHRDVKPSNIFLTETQRVVVTDFGIAKLSNKSVITTADMLVGTPQYFAPEIANGQPADHRVDIYAMGVLFYQFLTNQYPFDSDGPLQVIAQHINAPIPDPRSIHEDLPESVNEIVQKSMAKDPTARYRNFAAMIADVDALCSELGIMLESPKSYTPTPRSIPTTNILARADITPADSTSRPDRPHSGKVPPQTSPSAVSITLPSMTVTFPIWRLMAGLVGLIAIVILGYLVLRPDAKIPNTPKATALPPLTIEPAQEGEYLYLVANITNDQHPAVNVPRQLLNAIEGGSLQGILGSQFRSEYVDRTLHNTAEAKALAEETGALMVIWGEEDATGLEVVLYIPSYSPQSLGELHFRVSIQSEAEYADIVSHDLKQLIPYVAEFMTSQQRLRDNTFLAGLDIGQVTEPAWEDVSALRIEPATTLERELLNFMNLIVAKDYAAIDETITAILKIKPEESSLYFDRFIFNGFLLNRYELAKADIDILQRLLPDSPIGSWCRSTLDIFANNYAALYEFNSNLISADPNSKDGQIGLFHHALAAIMLGKYSEVEPDALALNLDYEYELFNFPAQANLLAFVYQLKGDTEAAQPYIEVVRADRRITEMGTKLASVSFVKPPAALLFWFGFALETNGETQIAKGSYLLLMNNEYAPYLAHWRRGVMDEQAGDWARASNSYQSSIDASGDNPLPIVQYQLAALLQSHPELEPETRQVCTLLASATETANIQPEFYSVLLGKIRTLQTEAGCQ